MKIPNDTRVFSFFLEEDIEKFITVTSGLFSEPEYFYIRDKIEELIYRQDMWKNLSKSLNADQLNMLNDLYGAPDGWPFELIIALDELVHNKAIMALTLADVGIGVFREIEINHRNMVNLTNHRTLDE